MYTFVYLNLLRKINKFFCFKNKMTLIVKSNIKKVVKDLDKDNSVSSVAEEVGVAMEKKVEDMLVEAIKRAKANGRRTLQARDL